MKNRASARLIAVAAVASFLAAACGGSASPVTTTSTPTPSTTPTATAVATAATSTEAWAVSDKSKATIRVREQLVGVNLPSDAVLTATGATGSFDLHADGTFASTKVSGLSLPLATSGSFTFTLTGNMTIRGKTKEVTFDVVAKRDGSDLTATATASPSWKFGDFGMTAPSVPFRVVSVTDEIRVAIDLVATGPKS